MKKIDNIENIDVSEKRIEEEFKFLFGAGCAIEKKEAIDYIDGISKETVSAVKLELSKSTESIQKILQIVAIGLIISIVLEKRSIEIEKISISLDGFGGVVVTLFIILMCVVFLVRVRVDRESKMLDNGILNKTYIAMRDQALKNYRLERLQWHYFLRVLNEINSLYNRYIEERGRIIDDYAQNIILIESRVNCDYSEFESLKRIAELKDEGRKQEKILDNWKSDIERIDRKLKSKLSDIEFSNIELVDKLSQERIVREGLIQPLMDLMSVSCRKIAQSAITRGDGSINGVLLTNIFDETARVYKKGFGIRRLDLAMQVYVPIIISIFALVLLWHSSLLSILVAAMSWFGVV